jgi:hypothetical protein
MSYHNIISNKIVFFLDTLYYKNLKKLYNQNLDIIFQSCKFPIIKPEYFIFFQYYFTYLSLYYLNRKNIILYSLSLQLIHLCALIYDNLILKYSYIPKNNTNFLKNTSYSLFIYLFYLKILLLKIKFYKKILMLSSFSIFYFLHNLNYIYNERLKCIESKEDFKHPLKILIISPNKEFIENIIYKTKFFTYDNFFLFINLFIFIFNR